MENKDGNQVLSMYEGSIKNGKPDGFGRKFEVMHETVHVGFWKEGKPSGKHIHYNDKGVYQEGIWEYNDGSVKEQVIKTFSKKD